MWHSEPRNPDRNTELKQVHYQALLAITIRITLTIRNEMTIAKDPVMSFVFRLLIYSIPCPDRPPNRWDRSPTCCDCCPSDHLAQTSGKWAVCQTTDIRQVSCLSDHRHPTGELSVRPQTSGKRSVCQTTDIRQVSCLSDHRHPGG